MAHLSRLGLINHAHVIIDVSNVLGALPKLQWWRNRAAATKTVLDQVVKWNADTGGAQRVSFVIEGLVERSFADRGQQGGVTIVHSKFRGRDACDDAIVDLVSALDSASRLTSVVVTSDKVLRQRIQDLGCNVVGVRTLLEAIESRRLL